MHTTFSLITASHDEQSPSIAVVAQDRYRARAVSNILDVQSDFYGEYLSPYPRYFVESNLRVS